MKVHFFLTVLLFVSTYAAAGQNDADSVARRDVGIMVLDSRSIYVDKDGGMYGARGGSGVIKIQTLGGGNSPY